MSTAFPDPRFMQRALELAVCGQGFVEPIPLVGCVIVRDDQIVGEGWHPSFGGPHAEVIAIQNAGGSAAGADMYVTLEPCCHHGKTPPCTDAVIAAGIRRVAIALPDPFPKVAGGGIRQLKEAGIEAAVGVGQQDAAALTAPFRKLVQRGLPWVIAKWAMTLDGKIASRTRSSQWISNAESRQIAHQLRGRVDAVVIGRGTAEADDPLLTARPAGPRTALRVVLDSHGNLSPDGQLVRTASQWPVLVAVGPTASLENQTRLTEAGCEVFCCAGDDEAERLGSLLKEFGRRQFTNVLVEGGAQVLGVLFDLGEIDEAHAFIATKLIGGATALGPIAGGGISSMADALALTDVRVERIAEDIYVRGRKTQVL